MDESKDLLVELGLEELPHEIVYPTLRDFRELFTAGLSNARIGFADVREYSTPRRIALYIRKVRTRQEDYTEEKKGPSLEKAYDENGGPSKALQGFLKGNGVSLKDVTERKTDNGDYIFLVRRIQGKDTAGILPSVLDETIGSLRFRKSMRWEKSGFAFARPVRWIVFLFGNDVIPYEIAGVRSGRLTRGHRTYRREAVEIFSPEEYEQIYYQEQTFA